MRFIEGTVFADGKKELTIYGKIADVVDGEISDARAQEAADGSVFIAVDAKKALFFNEATEKWEERT